MSKRQLRGAPWKDVRKEMFAEDPELRAAYDALGPRYEFISAVIGARKERGWMQADLAKACGTSQPAIARLESGDQDPKLDTMVKVCNVLGLPLTVGSGARLAG